MKRASGMGASSFEECCTSASAAWAASAPLQYAYPDFSTFLQQFLISFDACSSTTTETGLELLAQDVQLMTQAQERMDVARAPLLGAPASAFADRFGDRLVLWAYGPIVQDGLGFAADRVLEELELHSDASAIYLRVDCGGGNLNAARAIAQALIRHKATKLAIIDRACWSAGVFITIAADRVLIRRNATVMLHRVVSTFRGNDLQMLHRAYDLRSEDSRYRADISRRRSVGMDVLEALWNEERFLSAEETVAVGLADRIIAALPALITPVAA